MGTLEKRFKDIARLYHHPSIACSIDTKACLSWRIRCWFYWRFISCLIWFRAFQTGETYEQIVENKLNEFKDEVVLAKYALEKRIKDSGKQDIYPN